METHQINTIDSFLNEILMHDAEIEETTNAGIPALHRLVAIAKGDTGQCSRVRLFLLGLYNGHRFPFDLTQLRGLDKPIFDDCMAVLTMDARATQQEVHQYIENGSELFERWASL